MRNLMTAALCGLFFMQCSGTQSTQPAAEPESPLQAILPTDPAIRIGKLENGLTYYIRHNSKPENRAELRLAVNAGSILEAEDQLGLAHFAEHMAFNGTESFARQELVDYVESIGVRFGPHLNAYTSFDETVYMLQIPVDSVAIVDTGLKILQEWAGKVSFTEEEIDKERGVVIEEWRTGRGADARIRDLQFPVLFQDSRYAGRLPIGKTEVLASFPYEAIRRFYRDWYRPDLMAVVAIGDFDVDEMEAKIRAQFTTIPAAAAPAPRPFYEVPDHKETLYSIVTDAEATRNNVNIYYKRPVSDSNTQLAYRQSLVAALFLNMFNARLDELRQLPEPPFLFGYAAEGNFIRTKKFALLSAVAPDGGIPLALRTLLVEAERARSFGFTASELARHKKEMLRGMEQAFRERDNTPSRNYAAEYIRNFLSAEPIPGIEFEYNLYQTFIPGISLEEVNQLVRNWLGEENRVVLVDAPEKEGVSVPQEADLQAIFAAVGSEEITPYIDRVSNDPLIAAEPAAGKILSKSSNEELGTSEWLLSNGIRVVLKPTDFKNDELLLSAYSPGGHSLVEDEDFVAAQTAASVVEEGGLGSFPLLELQKKLSGKVVSVSPAISELYEGLSGSASPEDLETWFQLIYLTFTSPRRDEDAFRSLLTQYRAFLENRAANPASAFRDTLQTTLAQYHFRAQPLSPGFLKSMDLDRSLEIYRDRFADAGDFTFLFVGNIDAQSFEPLVKRYLASLPSSGRVEKWRDIGMRSPQGVIKKTVYRGLEPQSQVRIVFTGPLEWSRQARYDLNAMASVLRIKLRESLREDKGGTYGVGVGASRSRDPQPEYSLSISFGCAPERVEELVATVFSQIDSLRREPVADIYLQKVKETQRRGQETNLKENSYWLSTLQFYYQHNEDPAQIYELPEFIERLDKAAIQRAAQLYLNLSGYVQVVLMPEDRDPNRGINRKS